MHGGAGKTGKRRRRIALILLAVHLCLFGCTRRFYRERADREVDALLAEKDRFPQWRIEQEHVYPDPRARFGDPTNPDRPPMPPDDPAAELLSPHPQKPGKAGVALIEGAGYLDLLAAWDRENRLERTATDPGADAVSANLPASGAERQQAVGNTVAGLPCDRAAGS